MSLKVEHLLKRRHVRYAIFPQIECARSSFDGSRRGRKRRAIRRRHETTSPGACVAKKTKSKSMSGSSGSNTSMFLDLMSTEFRLQRESAQEKDRAMI
nr:hypothetical protein [Tanacetum cinerariifolium]